MEHCLQTASLLIMKIDLNKIKYPEEFEQLCRKLLVAMHPDAKALRGSDEGLDSFIGNFNGNVKCWQFKFFPRFIRKSQKEQIKKSLKRALRQHTVSEWTLCIPLILSKSEQTWFQELQKNNPALKIDYWNKDKIETLLQKYKEVRDEYFPEEEWVEKVLGELRRGGEFSKEIVPKIRGEQISAFKMNIIGISVEKFMKLLEDAYPRDRKNRFLKFKEVEKRRYNTKFLVNAGRQNLKIYLENEDNPFQLLYPHVKSIEIWIKEEKGDAPSLLVTCFTSDRVMKMHLIKVLKEILPGDLIFKEINFNRTMKELVTKTFEHTITTIALDPALVEKVRSEFAGEIVDVSINDYMVHSKEGGLPKTKFMKNALALVKTVKSDGKESDITFFKAKQTTSAIKGKVITLYLHNDGKVRIFYKPGEDKIEMMKSLDKFIDSIAK